MTVKKAYQTLFITVFFMMLAIIFYALNVSKLTLSWAMSGFAFSMIVSILTVVMSIRETKHRREVSEGFWAKQRFEILDWLTFLSVSLMGIFLVFMFLILPSIVKYSSMSPTLSEGDRVVIYHFQYEPEYLDIVIVQIDEETYYIKRVQALPGDTIRFFDDGLGSYIIQINGEFPKSPEDILYKTDQRGKDRMESMMDGEVLMANYYLVFGDNANNSIDSRSSDIGPVHIDQIVGKAIFRLWPFGGLQ
ncbi:MAG: signal peptidase I [Acholeplasmataceae bacterium]|nr:signal peptidase I [Acholeplasmataceae bacterium]